MTYGTADIWTVIVILGFGTFLIRFSFLGLIGDRPMPGFVLRLLRFTPVAVLPGMVAPLVLWPQATGGEPDAIRLFATLVTVVVGLWTRNVLWAIVGGIVAFYGAMAMIAVI